MKLWQMLLRLFKNLAPSAARVVVDTNIPISGTIGTQGFPAKIIDAATAKKIRFVASRELIDEYLDVIQRPHIVKHYKEIGDRVDDVLFYLNTNAVLVEVQIEPVVLDDPADDFLIACALAGKASYIISGDEHLLALREYRGIEILTPRDFVLNVLRESNPASH